MIGMRYLVSKAGYAGLFVSLLLFCSGAVKATDPSADGYLNIPTAAALGDPTKSAVFMTVEIAPDVRHLVDGAAFDFSNGTDKSSIPIWREDARRSRYIVGSSIVDKYGLPPGRYGWMWAWVHKTDGTAAVQFFDGLKIPEEKEYTALTAGDDGKLVERTFKRRDQIIGFEVGPGEWIYLGHIVISFAGDLEGFGCTGKKAIKNHADMMATLFTKTPHIKMITEDRYDEFVAGLPPEIAAKVQKRLLKIKYEEWRLNEPGQC